MHVMTILQWLGFAGIVVGAFYYVTRPALGSLATASGCVFLGVWALRLDPPAYGTFSVQAAVVIFSIRNAVLHWSKP